MYSDYELISSTAVTQTSNELAVSEITFSASPDWTTIFDPPSKICRAEPAGIGASFTKWISFVPSLI